MSKEPDVTKPRKYPSSAYIKTLMAENNRRYLEPLVERVNLLERALAELITKLDERDAKLYEGLSKVVGPIDDRVAKLERPIIEKLRDHVR